MPDYKKVEFSQLSKADIIFTTSDAAESAGIRKATNANPCAVYKSPHLSYIGHLETPFKTNSNLTEKERERYRRMGYRKDN